MLNFIAYVYVNSCFVGSLTILSGCHNFLKGRKVKLPSSNRTTCFLMSMKARMHLKGQADGWIYTLGGYSLGLENFEVHHTNIEIRHSKCQFSHSSSCKFLKKSANIVFAGKRDVQLSECVCK